MKKKILIFIILIIIIMLAIFYIQRDAFQDEKSRDIEIGAGGTQGIGEENPEPPQGENEYPVGQDVVLPEENECSNLNEQECLENDKCKGIYGPSQCLNGECSNDEVFQFCSKLNEEEYQDYLRNKELCEETSGSWYFDEYSQPGRCICQQYDGENSELFFEYGSVNFVENLGCISAKEICINEGGTWQKPEPSSTEERFDINEENCVTQSVYAILTWKAEESFCLIERYTDPNPKCF